MRCLAFNQRRGVTLIELIVTLAVLSVVLVITTLSLAGEKRPKIAVVSVSAQVRLLRSAAITSGIPQTVTVDDSTGATLLTALPDGRVVSDMRNLDRMAGIARGSNAR